jgi:hypothetical protein
VGRIDERIIPPRVAVEMEQAMQNRFDEEAKASSLSRYHCREALRLPGCPNGQREAPDLGPPLLSPRSSLRDAGLAAARALVQVPDLLTDRGWSQAALAATPDLVHDTFDGLVAFIVPGPDAYSLHQGVSAFEPGGIAANVTDLLIATLDQSAPFVPHFAATVAAILNSVARQVNPQAPAVFPSPFARLAFPQKVRVFAAMDSFDPLKPLSGILPALVAVLADAEAGVFGPATRAPAEPLVGPIQATVQ